MVAVMVPAPKDAAELHRDYYAYVKHLLLHEGIPSQEVEDAASDIFARLLHLDVIGQFDPEHVIEYGGQTVAPNFRTFLTRKIQLYARGQRDKLKRRDTREVLLCDRLVGSGDSWIEVFGGQEHWDDYSELNAKEFVARIRSYLTTLGPRSARDRCDLVALFDEMVRQGWDDSKLDFSVFQDMFGISPTSAYQWVSRVREVIKAVPADYVPAPPRSFVIGGVELAEDDLREALEILKSGAGGIMVRQPLARTAFAAAAKGWYHPFSKEEIKLYPELAIDPQTHKKPAGHVRLAVVHRLERMLGGEGVPAGQGSRPGGSFPEPPLPADPDLPEDLFEAALWQLGADAAAVDRIKALAASVYA